MNDPRILAIIGNMSGCEAYRILFPFSHLNKQGYNCRWVTVQQIKDVDIDHFDVIVMPRLGLLDPEKVDALFSYLREKNKVTVYEIDDDLINVPDWNPSKMDGAHVEGLISMIRRCDLVTASTPHLAMRMRQYNPNVVVLPNCIDPNLWAFKREGIRQISGLTVGVHGGNSHDKDWEILADVFPTIAGKYPEVKFIVAGHHPKYFDDLNLGDRLVKIGWVPVQQYPAVVYQIDIALCPLIDDLFNRSKSNIKAMESAMCGAPVVASPTVYNTLIQHGTTGFIARDKQEWIRYISRLIEKPKLRKEIGVAARGYVLRHLNIHDKASLWMAAYKTAWQTRTKA